MDIAPMTVGAHPPPPVKTPRDVVMTLNKATVSALKLPDAARRMRDLGYTIVGDAPEVFGEFITADIETWRKIVKQERISAEYGF